MKNSEGKKKQIKLQVWTYILRFILRQTKKKKIRIANLVKCRIVCTFLDFCVFVLICHAHSNNRVDVTSWQLTGLEYLNTDLVAIKQQYIWLCQHYMITCIGESSPQNQKIKIISYFDGVSILQGNKFQLLNLWSFARGRGRGAGEMGQRIFVLCT